MLIRFHLRGIASLATLAGVLLNSETTLAQFGIPSIPSIPNFPVSIPAGRSEPAPTRARTYSTPVSQAAPVKTQTQRRRANPDDPVWNDGTRRFALIVGVNSYESPDFPALPGIDQDARRIQESLIRGGFQSENVRLLTPDAADSRLRPTRAAIQNQVDALLRQAGEKDLVMVMLIGHGLSLNHTSYFCPADAAPDARFSAAEAEASLLSIPALARRLGERKIAQKLLVVDACRDTTHSSTRGFQSPPKDLGDVWLINSCSEGEFAWVGTPDAGDAPHALYSWHLCEGLNGKADAYGDLDGYVTILEAHKWALRRTVEAAANMQQIQTPRIFPGVGSFDVVRVSDAPTGRMLSTGDRDLEQKQSAQSLAARAKPVVFDDHEYFNQEVIRQIKEDRRINPELFQDHHNLMCYVFGNYLTPALDLDEDCADAHLVRGYGYRASGEYAAALEEYRAAGVPMEVFASGRIGSKDDFLTTDGQGNALFNVSLNDQQIRQQIETVLLRRTPDFRAPQVRQVLAASNLIVTEVREVPDADGGSEQWLLVTKIDDRPLPVPGWIHESSVHWFKEAGQMYVASSSLNGDLPAVVANQQHGSVVAMQSAEVVELQQADDDLRQVQDVLGFASRFGAPIPGEVYSGIGVARTVINIVHSAKVQEQSYAWQSYQEAAELAPQIMAERIRLLRSRKLDAIHPRPVLIPESPWRLASSGSDSEAGK